MRNAVNLITALSCMVISAGFFSRHNLFVGGVVAGVGVLYVWKAVAQDIPCRVSYKTVAPAGRSDTVDSIAQAITLFTAPDIDIKPGSRVTVTQRGRMMRFSCSGVPAVYESHQEVPLTRWEEHP